MTNVTIKTGTEGPKYDPYSFTEVTVERCGHKFFSHEGLGEFYKIDGEKTTYANWIEKSGGYPHQFVFWKMLGRQQQVEHHLKSCPKRDGCRDVDGFPGESLLVCGCGKVLDYEFDRSAIE